MSIYSGTGGAKYFDEREAHELIYSGDRAQWCGLMINKVKETLNDNGNLYPLRQSYFISLRSSYLVLRQENSFIVEPYSPNRFSRQFGFCQGILGDLKNDVHSATLDQALKHWCICITKSTFVSVLLPAHCDDPKVHTTPSYREW